MCPPLRGRTSRAVFNTDEPTIALKSFTVICLMASLFSIVIGLTIYVVEEYDIRLKRK